MKKYTSPPQESQSLRPTGVFSWFGFFEPFERRLERIQAAGFDGVMLWWEDETAPAHVPRQRMVPRAEELGLTVFNIHMAGTDDNAIWSDDLRRRSACVDNIRRTITEMADCGQHNLVLHLCEKGDVPPPNQWLLRSIEELLPTAEANRTVLSLENTWRADYLPPVWQAFPVKELGFCFDTSHANLRDQYYLLYEYSHLLSACHIGDNDGLEDRHWLPFDGAIDFAPLMPPLLAAKIPLTLELLGDKTRYHDPDQHLREARARLERLMALAPAVESTARSRGAKLS